MSMLLTMIDTLPLDVQGLIFEMNPEHREHFRALEGELKSKSVMYRCNRVVEIFQENYGDTSFESCLFHNIDDPEIIMEGLLNCNCCDTHKTKKPCSLTDPGDYTGIESPLYLKKNCSCSCRNLSRFVYRTFRR